MNSSSLMHTMGCPTCVRILFPGFCLVRFHHTTACLCSACVCALRLAFTTVSWMLRTAASFDSTVRAQSPI